MSNCELRGRIEDALTHLAMAHDDIANVYKEVRGHLTEAVDCLTDALDLLAVGGRPAEQGDLSAFAVSDPPPLVRTERDDIVPEVSARAVTEMLDGRGKTPMVESVAEELAVRRARDANRWAN